MKFKIGDICIPLEPDQCSSFSDEIESEFIKITDIDEDKYTSYEILDRDKNRIGSCSCYKVDELKLATKSNLKVIPDKFVVIWDEDRDDPSEFFKTKPQAQKKINELMNNKRVEQESVRLIEIKQEWKIKPSHSLSLVK